MVAPNQRLNAQSIEVFSPEEDSPLNDQNTDADNQTLASLTTNTDIEQYLSCDTIEEVFNQSFHNMFELHKYVREWCRVSDDDIQLWVGTNKRLSFGPIDHWIQRRSITKDLELVANGLKPVKGSANKFVVNEINESTNGSMNGSINENEVEIQFTNRNGFCGQFPISEDCKIIATTRGSQLFILTLPYVETNEVIGIRPNDGFVLIHSNLSVYNTPKPLNSTQTNCDNNDNNNSELKTYYSSEENGHLFILGEGGHLLLIDKRDMYGTKECVLLVGIGSLDLFSLFDLRSFPRSSGSANSSHTSGGQSKRGPHNCNNSSIDRTFGSSSDTSNTGRQVNGFDHNQSVKKFNEFNNKRQCNSMNGQMKKQKCSYS